MNQDSPPKDLQDTGPSLTPRQRSALPVIVASISLADASRHARDSLSTLKRWMKQPEFVDELNRLNDAALDIANRQLQALMLRAVANLNAAMDHSNPNVRLSATRMTLQYGTKLTQLNDTRLQARLSALDTETPDTRAPDIDATDDDASPAQTCHSSLIPATELCSLSPNGTIFSPAPKLDGPKWTEMDRNLRD